MIGNLDRKKNVKRKKGNNEEKEPKNNLWMYKGDIKNIHTKVWEMVHMWTLIFSKENTLKINTSTPNFFTSELKQFSSIFMSVKSSNSNILLEICICFYTNKELNNIVSKPEIKTTLDLTKYKEKRETSSGRAPPTWFSLQQWYL